jgi:hypothetical protein
MDRRIGRRRIIVDGRFQIGVAIRIVACVYVYLALFALLANVPAIHAIVVRGDDTAAYVAAVERLKVFLEVFVLPLALTFVAMCLHGLFLTHRMAGPIHRLRSTLRDMRGKVLPAEFSLRKGDYFLDLCEDVNGLLTTLRSEVMESRRLCDEMAGEAQALEAAGGLSKEAREHLLRMANGFTRLRQVVDGYRLEGEPEAVKAEGKGVGAVSAAC